MENNLTHEIELYTPDSFKILLEHEIHRSRRYKHPLTLIHIAVEADPNNPETQHSAEMFAINVLNLNLREADIPCKRDDEFIILIPSTDEQGGRIVCQRLESLFNVQRQTYDRVSFKMAVYIGMASSPEASLSSNELRQQASTAMQHARTHQLSKAVLFSEIP
jgi:diguanylate cyclase (GGDEF)-like protein